MTASDLFEMPVAVAVKACGCLDGDLCSCACDETKDRIELAAVMSEPILLPAHAGVPCLTDPALLVYRPSLEMVAEMEPPLRWSVTDAGVSVSLGVNP